MRRRWWSLALCVALVGCTSGAKPSSKPAAAKPAAAPPRTTVTVLASADRIRLGQTRLGGAAGCLDDEYCAAGLSRVYGIDLGDRQVALASPAATVSALVGGVIDVAALAASASPTGQNGITRLVDDRGLSPSDNVVPVVPTALAARADVVTALDAITAQIDQSSLDAIQGGVAAGTDPSAEAQQWLGSNTGAVPGPGQPALQIVVGARADPDSVALSDLYAGALARAGWTASVDPLDGDRGAELDALAAGTIDVAIDNAAGLLEQLDGFAGLASHDLLPTMAQLRSALSDAGLRALTPALASPQTVFAVSNAVASSLGLATLSDLAKASGARIPAPPAAPPPPAPIGPASTPVAAPLGVGATGAAVQALQARLSALGYAVAASATFDEATRRAVVAFQLDQGLIDDGVVDPRTAAALAGAHPATHPATAPRPGDPQSVRPPTTASGAPAVYLAFGGGPSDVTTQILDLLHRHAALATFFIDDDALQHHPDIAQAIVANGDVVGISMSPHNAASPVAADAVLRTAAQTQDDLGTVLRTSSTSCLLAPYGADQASMRDMEADRGLRSVLWDIDAGDWRNPGASVIAADITGSVEPGSVVLLHDGGGDRSQTAAALATILDVLSARGYRFAAIPGC